MLLNWFYYFTLRVMIDNKAKNKMTTSAQSHEDKVMRRAYVSKLISAEGGRKFWPLGGVFNPRQQGGSGGVDWSFQNHLFFLVYCYFVRFLAYMYIITPQ